MTTNCQNCNKELNGYFCSNCGQSSATHKINLHFLWHDIQHGLLHIDKGILFTAKELFTRPGHSIREFLQGKRVRHFKPISLVILLAGIYGFLSHYFDINLLSNNIEVTGSGEKFNQTKATIENMSEWMSQHYSVLTLLQIPVFSIGTFICFKKVGYNFIEHLVINSFIAGQKLILHIAVFPLYYWFNQTSFLRTTARLSDFIGHAIAMLTIFQLFNNLNYFQRSLRTLLSLLVPLIVVFLILTLVSKLILG